MMCLLKLLLSGCCVSRAWERSAGSDLALVFLLPSLQEHKGQLVSLCQRAEHDHFTWRVVTF